MGVREEHPHQLLWHVSGSLGAKERRDLERHLEECDECRAESETLSSMMRSLRIQSRVEHVAAEDLVLYEEEAASLPAGRRSEIRIHLDECPRCREDLEVVRNARLRAAGEEAPRESIRRSLATRWGWLAALAASVILAVLAWGPGRIPAKPEPPAPRAARAVVFPAPRRGASETRTLEGYGPWSIRVLLPFDAKEGSYRADIGPAGGAPLAGLGTTLPADADRCLTLLLPDLPGPGSYDLTLRPDSPGGETLYRYPFVLLPPAGPGGRP